LGIAEPILIISLFDLMGYESSKGGVAAVLRDSSCYSFVDLYDGGRRSLLVLTF